MMNKTTQRAVVGVIAMVLIVTMVLTLIAPAMGN